MYFTISPYEKVVTLSHRNFWRESKREFPVFDAKGLFFEAVTLGRSQDFSEKTAVFALRSHKYNGILRDKKESAKKVNGISREYR